MKNTVICNPSWYSICGKENNLETIDEWFNLSRHLFVIWLKQFRHNLWECLQHRRDDMKQIKLNDMAIECILFNRTKSMAVFTRSELKNHIIMIISDPKIDTHTNEVSNIDEPCLFHKLWQNRHPRWWFWVTLQNKKKKRIPKSVQIVVCLLVVVHVSKDSVHSSN